MQEGHAPRLCTEVLLQPHGLWLPPQGSSPQTGEEYSGIVHFLWPQFQYGSRTGLLEFWCCLSLPVPVTSDKLSNFSELAFCTSEIIIYCPGRKLLHLLKTGEQFLEN